MLIVISIATVSGFLIVCYALLFSGGNQRDQSFRYSVLVEGGSTVSRIHVYTYQVESVIPVSEFSPVYCNYKLHPGLSAYADDPDGASVSLTELVEFAKGKIPKGMWMETEVRLMVTAGKSLLQKPVQEKFLKVAREVLKSSGFMFRDEWASITSGSEDDVNAWVVTNLALGSLGGDPVKIRESVEVIEASWGTEKVFAQGQADASRGTEKVFPQGQADAGGKTALLVTIMILILVVVISLRK